MEAKDLRIGNYVHVDLSIDDIEVVKLKIGDLASFAIGLRDLFPIQITEEWLIKFGGNCVIVEGYPIYYVNPFDIEYYENESVLIMGNSSVKIKYVHQLQNLYYALTGEELVLNN